MRRIDHALAAKEAATAPDQIEATIQQLMAASTLRGYAIFVGDSPQGCVVVGRYWATFISTMFQD